VLTNRPDYITAVHPMDNLPGTDHDSVEYTVCVYPPRQSTSDKKLRKQIFWNYCPMFLGTNLTSSLTLKMLGLVGKACFLLWLTLLLQPPD